jgi:ABC-type Fe3+ transport system permease subunit
MTSPYVTAPDRRRVDSATAAFVSFPSAVLCLLSPSTLVGLGYVLAFTDPLALSRDSGRSIFFAGHVVSAVFAAVPLVLALAGLSRLQAQDPWWLRPLLRAAVLLAAAAVTLKLVSAVLILIDPNPGFSGTFPTRL